MRIWMSSLSPRCAPASCSLTSGRTRRASPRRPLSVARRSRSNSARRWCRPIRGIPLRSPSRPSRPRRPAAAALPGRPSRVSIEMHPAKGAREMLRCLDKNTWQHLGASLRHSHQRDAPTRPGSSPSARRSTMPRWPRWRRWQMTPSDQAWLKLVKTQVIHSVLVPVIIKYKISP